MATMSPPDPEVRSLLAAVAPQLAERDELAVALADPATHADPDAARKVGGRYAVLDRLAHAATEAGAAAGDLQATAELAAEDPTFADELEPARARRDTAVATLRRLLIPRDPDDSRDVLLEIKAGEGGTESALFAADLLRMYTRYAERRGWRTELLDETQVDLGGVKSATLAVKAAPGATDPDNAPYARLKFEGGVHRVQRVPVTESAGRVHTSAAGVLVMPEAAEVEVHVDPNDLRIDVFRSSGPGGQSVNTTDSAVRITHLPSGIVVSCQNEKSQLQNREQALRILRARLLVAARETADAATAAQRHSQVRTVDRSERIRTYNFPENRIADHRVGYKAYSLDQVIDGDLDAIIGANLDADEQARLDAAPGGPAAAPGGPAAAPGRAGSPVTATVTDRWTALVAMAATRLAAAGVGSPGVDAELLAAHTLGVPRSVFRTRLLAGAAAEVHVAAAFDALVERRAGRVPLQHLTGSAPFRYLELAVGPGVFVPRPETELLAGWAVEQAARVLAAAGAVTVLDIGTGSGAIAASVAHEVPGATVLAVEVDPAAASWAERNLDEYGVPVFQLDGRDLPALRPDLCGGVDVLVTNPPYIPLTAWESVAPEVRDHDPATALWGGDDGLEVVRGLLRCARVLLGAGGVLGIEHAEAQAASLPALLAADGAFVEVRDHDDLAGRPRFTTARRTAVRENGRP